MSGIDTVDMRPHIRPGQSHLLSPSSIIGPYFTSFTLGPPPTPRFQLDQVHQEHSIYSANRICRTTL